MFIDQFALQHIADRPGEYRAPNAPIYCHNVTRGLCSRARFNFIPETFPTRNETGKQPVLNAGTKSGPGRGFSRTVMTGNFPDLSGKNPGPGKWHSGTQNSRCNHQYRLHLQAQSHLGPEMAGFEPGTSKLRNRRSAN